HYERANALISNDFRYFGRDGKAEYKKQFGLIKEAVERLGRGYRVNHHHDLRAQLCVLKQQIWKSTRQADVGTPTSSPTLRVSHRTACGNCGSTGPFEETRFGDEGEIYSFAVVHQTVPGLEAPYVAAIVDLDDGVSVRANVYGLDISKPGPEWFGKRVKMFTEK